MFSCNGLILGPMSCDIGNIYVYENAVLEQVVIPTYSPGCSTIFDFVVAHSDSKLRTGVVSNDAIRRCHWLVAFIKNLYYYKSRGRSLLSAIALSGLVGTAVLWPIHVLNRFAKGIPELRPWRLTSGAAFAPNFSAPIGETVYSGPKKFSRC